MSDFDNAIDGGDASTDSGFDLHELIEIDDSTDDDVVECHPRPVAPPPKDDECNLIQTSNSVEAQDNDAEDRDDDDHEVKNQHPTEMVQQPAVDVVTSSDQGKTQDEPETEVEVEKLPEPVTPITVAKKSPKTPRKKQDTASDEEKKPNNIARCGGRGRGRGRGSPRAGRGGTSKSARHSSSSSPAPTDDLSTSAPADTSDSQKSPATSSPTLGRGAAKIRGTRSPRGKSKSPSAAILAPATPPSSLSSLSAFSGTFTPPHTPNTSDGSIGSVTTEEFFAAKTPPSTPTPLPPTPPKTPKRKRKVSATSADVEVVIESSPSTAAEESPVKKKRVYKPRVKKVPAAAADTKEAGASCAAAGTSAAAATPAIVASTMPVAAEGAPATREAEEDPDAESSQLSEASQSQSFPGSATRVTKKAKSTKPKGHWTAEEMMQLFTHVYRRDWSPDWEVVARSVGREAAECEAKLGDLNKTLEAYLAKYPTV